jgi:hypothetical protein
MPMQQLQRCAPQDDVFGPVKVNAYKFGDVVVNENGITFTHKRQQKLRLKL